MRPAIGEVTVQVFAASSLLSLPVIRIVADGDE